MSPTIHPYTDADLSEGQIIVQQLHGLKGYDAWVEHIAKALAHERERCAEIVEGEVYKDQYRKWPQISAEGNRANDSEIVRHCDALAILIRRQH